MIASNGDTLTLRRWTREEQEDLMELTLEGLLELTHRLAGAMRLEWQNSGKIALDLDALDRVITMTPFEASVLLKTASGVLFTIGSEEDGKPPQ